MWPNLLMEQTGSSYFENHYREWSCLYFSRQLLWLLCYDYFPRLV